MKQRTRNSVSTDQVTQRGLLRLGFFRSILVASLAIALLMGVASADVIIKPTQVWAGEYCGELGNDCFTPADGTGGGSTPWTATASVVYTPANFDVGIGIAAPVTKLHVAAADAGSTTFVEVARFTTLGSIDIPYVTVGDEAVGKGGYLSYNKNDGQFQLGQRGVGPALAIDKNQNVGVLTGNLYVQGECFKPTTMNGVRVLAAC